MREPLQVLYMDDSGSKRAALLRQLRAQGYEATRRIEGHKTMGRALAEQPWDVVPPGYREEKDSLVDRTSPYRTI